MPPTSLILFGNSLLAPAPLQSSLSPGYSDTPAGSVATGVDNLIVPFNGVITEMWVLHNNTATLGGQPTTVYEIYHNNVATGEFVTLSPNSAEGQDVVNIAVVTGDRIGVRASPGVGGTDAAEGIVVSLAIRAT